MSVGLLECSQAFRSALASFDPAVLSGDDCRVLAEDLALTGKACAAAVARAAARAAECGAHRGSGFTNPDEWLARTNGTSRREANSALDTARSVAACPALGDALAAGELSSAQAGEIAKTVAKCPDRGEELVGLAKTSDLATLREKARKIRLEADDAEDLHRRQTEARSFRHWTNDLGMVAFCGALPPEVGVPLMNRLDAETDRVRREARRAGSTEGRQAHAADALVKMIEGAGKGRANRCDVVFVCDLRAYRRGYAEPDECCHIVSGGPVPVSVIRDAVDDAFVKAVTHDGIKIDTVVHYGRHMSAELRTALDLGLPPDFEGTTCADGCGRRYGLEWDHVNPVANRGPTSYENLQPRCWSCHREKTEEDRQAGLLGGVRVGARAGPGDDPP